MIEINIELNWIEFNEAKVTKLLTIKEKKKPKINTY